MIAPFQNLERPSLFNIVKKHPQLHAWSADSINISGSTTTLIDFGSIGGLDMANVLAGSQPTYNFSDPGFNGKPTIRRPNTTSGGYLENSNSFRHSDTSGVITCVTETPIPPATNPPRMFSFTGGNEGNIARLNSPNGYYYISYDSAFQERLPNDLTFRRDVMSFFHNGVDLKVMLNGVIQAHTGGSDKWFSDFLPTKIGLLSFTTPGLGGIQTQGLTSYANYISEAEIINYHNELKNYYGIV